LSAAFVATFTQHDERYGAQAAWRLANLVVNAVALTLVPICLLGIVYAPSITRAIAPGFTSSPGKVALTVELTRIMMPFLLLVALAAIAMGILNTRNRFVYQVGDVLYRLTEPVLRPIRKVLPTIGGLDLSPVVLLLLLILIRNLLFWYVF